MTTQVMGKLLNSTLSFSEKSDSSNSFIALLMWLAIDRNNSWASETIKDTFFKSPIQYAVPLSSAVLWVMNNYVVLKNLETPSGQQILQRAIEWLEQAIDVASRGIRELRTTDAEDWTEEKRRNYTTYTK